MNQILLVEKQADVVNKCLLVIYKLSPFLDSANLDIKINHFITL